MANQDPEQLYNDLLTTAAACNKQAAAHFAKGAETNGHVLVATGAQLLTAAAQAVQAAAALRVASAQDAGK